MDVILLTV